MSSLLIYGTLILDIHFLNLTVQQELKQCTSIKLKLILVSNPKVNRLGGEGFPARKFSVMIDGSWMPSWMSKQESSDLGFISMFPVPYPGSQNDGRFGNCIPNTSNHKDLARELINIMLQPKILSPFIAMQGFLPKQIFMGQGPYVEQLRKSIPFFDGMVSMIPHGQSRPSIAEYSIISQFKTTRYRRSLV